MVAAVKDRRFPPIEMQEINDSLRVEISLLSNFEYMQDPLDWEVGTHGIRIEFTGPAGSPDAETVFSSTYLPHIAPE